MAARVLILLTSMLIFMGSSIVAMKLTQVVILSRHNARAPMTLNLEKYTPNVWPKWRENAAELTKKGAELENHIGDYFATWLRDKGLLDKLCPEKNAVFIHANNRQRTQETARAFVESAFKKCNISIISHKLSDIRDPVFDAVIRNSSEAFRKTAHLEMQAKIDELNLKDALKDLNEILNLSNSVMCKKESICDLLTIEDKIILKIGEQPGVDGPLNIGNLVVDALLMSYYNGDPFEQIGWGRVKESSSYWSFLTQLAKQNLNVRFNTTSTAHDVAELLLEEMANLFSNETIKFALLVGHDANLLSVMNNLKFKSYELRDQFEKTPIGSKLVFQKWYDKEKAEFLLKIEYIYQTAEQLRKGIKLSKLTPPSSLTMELEDCITDDNGFCSWIQFMDIMQKYNTNNLV